MKHKDDYDGKLGQVIEFLEVSDNQTDRKKSHCACGCCCTALVEVVMTPDWNKQEIAMDEP